jgi:hypothetical protein
VAILWLPGPKWSSAIGQLARNTLLGNARTVPGQLAGPCPLPLLLLPHLPQWHSLVLLLVPSTPVPHFPVQWPHSCHSIHSPHFPEGSSTSTVRGVDEFLSFLLCLSASLCLCLGISWRRFISEFAVFVLSWGSKVGGVGMAKVEQGICSRKGP